MIELQDNSLEIPFPIIFLGNLNEASNYIFEFIKKTNLRMSIPYDAVSPRDALRQPTIGTENDPLRSLRITHLEILRKQPQSGSERLELKTYLIDYLGKTIVNHVGLLKLTQLTTVKTRIEYFELSDLMRDDLILIWQVLLNLLDNEGLLLGSAIQGTRELAFDRPRWFPKGDSALRRWKRTWEIIRDTQEIYKEGYTGMSIEDPEPSLLELCEAVAAASGRKYSISTIKNIKKAGILGWLE